ncbi:hypothetical protein V5O48_009936, partial [Marasmius crinis-equi]
YLYLQPQPDLRHLEFNVMKELAEAVEKYEIYCAMGVCSHQMREHIAEHPVDVMLYAIRHKHIDILNECAVATLDAAPYTMLSVLPHNVYEAWISFVQTYQNLVSKEFTRFGPTRLHRGITVPCDIWYEHYALIASELSTAFDLGRTRRSSNASSYAFPGNSRKDNKYINASILARLPSFIERRQALTAERCADCKRELGYWIHQTERDWREMRQFSEFL